ncbi:MULTISPECIES: hypothetical protein [unclassified Caballeronia]|uniref:hypothetical protein n=1 Tax=unclassified Caballeronia TaxID=2646786 RepID=UPI0020277E09|nr:MULTISPECIES: hypothetical protein [unclassified Caballeronia]
MIYDVIGQTAKRPDGQPSPPVLTPEQIVAGNTVLSSRSRRESYRDLEEATAKEATLLNFWKPYRAELCQQDSAWRTYSETLLQ